VTNKYELIRSSLELLKAQKGKSKGKKRKIKKLKICCLMHLRFSQVWIKSKR